MSLIQAIMQGQQSVAGGSSPIPVDKSDRSLGQRSGITSNLVNELMGYTGGALGIETRSQNDVMSEQLAGVDIGSLEGMKQAAQILNKNGNIQGALAMMKNVQAEELRRAELAKIQQAKESAADQAIQLGMGTEFAQSIVNGGIDFKDASRLIREETQTRLLATRGEAGRRSLVKQVRLPWNDAYKYMDSQEFIAVINGARGESRAYSTADGENVVLLYRDGYVWDEERETYVRPSELNLQPAINQQRVLNSADVFTKELTNVTISNFKDLSEEAKRAKRVLDVNRDSIETLNRGINSGIFSGINTTFDRLLVGMGMSPDKLKLDNKGVNTQAFVNQRAQAVADVIKAFGSGTGLSNADREYALGLAAADAKIDEAALRKLMALEAKYAKMGLDKYNEVYQKMLNSTSTEQDRKLLSTWDLGVTSADYDYSFEAPIFVGGERIDQPPPSKSPGFNSNVQRALDAFNKK